MHKMTGLQGFKGLKFYLETPAEKRVHLHVRGSRAKADGLSIDNVLPEKRGFLAAFMPSEKCFVDKLYVPMSMS